MSRRIFLKCGFALSPTILMAFGCGGLRSTRTEKCLPDTPSRINKRKFRRLFKQQDRNASMTDGLPSKIIHPCRISVCSSRFENFQTPSHRQFLRHVVEELNLIEHCQADLVSVDEYLSQSVRSREGINADHVQPGESDCPQTATPQSVTFPDSLQPLPGSDRQRLVVINNVSLHPFRPMRLTAVVEVREAYDKSLISRESRTWDADRDRIPLDPHWLNRYRLGHPLDLDQSEDSVLKQTSPVRFSREVAKQLADELTDFAEMNSVA